MTNFLLVLVLAVPPVALAQSAEDIGELFASETTAHGPVLLAGTGMAVSSGSQLSAGKSVATLRLARGGEVRICPNASLTASGVQNNVKQSDQELMFSMDTGAVEFDYPLNDLEDTLITPDFRLVLSGPGVFHFALGVSMEGDTCIKSLRGNSASLIVSEMRGSSVYQVKPDEAVVFPGGKLSGRGSLVGDCGCPRPLPVLEAKQEPPSHQESERAGGQSKGISRSPLAADGGAPLTPRKPDDLHLEVDAPLDYRADQPDPVYAIAKIRFSALPNAFLAQENEKPIVLRPGQGEVSLKAKEKKGFFGRIGGFFAALFHK